MDQIEKPIMEKCKHGENTQSFQADIAFGPGYRRHWETVLQGSLSEGWLTHFMCIDTVGVYNKAHILYYIFSNYC